jgi:hypothetical protein
MDSAGVVLSNSYVSVFIVYAPLGKFLFQVPLLTIFAGEKQKDVARCFSCAHLGRVTHLVAHQNHAEIYVAPELSIDF